MFVGAALSGMFPWTRHVPAAALLSLATSHGRTYRVRWGVGSRSSKGERRGILLTVIGHVTWTWKSVCIVGRGGGGLEM